MTTPTDGRGPVTWADLVNFRPTVAVQHMEPNGWMVVGLDTNFYLDTGPEVQDDLLLGVPASVRFSPVAYHWTYGDGTTATTTTPGKSWAALRVEEFDRTSTSHIYRESGSYTVGVTVDFGAEYTFGGGGWVPIDGTLPITSLPLTGRAAHADTVLVARDCIADPHGPGC